MGRQGYLPIDILSLEGLKLEENSRKNFTHLFVLLIKTDSFVLYN